jgi:thiaminase
MGYEKSTLIAKSGDLWAKATTARFLTALQDGTLPDRALNRWLVQDRMFASDLYRFQSIVLSKVPEDARRPLLAGLNALEMELDWFAELQSRRDLAPDAPHPVCTRYTDFLLRSAYTEEYPRLLQILFGVEVAYLASFKALAESGSLPGGMHGELIERWSSDLFVAYVNDLLALTVRHPCPDDVAFGKVLRLEHDFWRMTWEG